MGKPINGLIKKMRNQPNGITPAEAEKVLLGIGFEFRRQKGSHKHFKRKSDNKRFTLVVSHNPIKKYLVDEIMMIIDESN